jgi:uncharacterized protein YdeI (YjbR/CyaY-like superfamily)
MKKRPLIPGKILNVPDRRAWRDWLTKHFDKEKEVWLVFPNKASGKMRIPYNDAVEEALCFGWIDSTAKKLDKHHSIQRFTPRNPKSTYSQANKERLKWLLRHDLVHPAIVQTVKKVLREKFIFPPDILAAIKADKAAWKNYRSFSEAYKRIRIAYIADARERPEEFQRRLKNFLEKTRTGKMIGFGGIEKHY